MKISYSCMFAVLVMENPLFVSADKGADRHGNLRRVQSNDFAMEGLVEDSGGDNRELQSGTCGGGNRGNGICSTGMCCSEWGWCGTTSAHCAGNPAPSPPSPSPPTGSGSCGGGNRGNGICSDGTCCSEWGWCGTTSAHCSGGNPAPAPSPPAPSPPTGGATAYITYHNYYSGQSLTTVSCSDGSNGLMTRWGYSNIDPMSPYVTATSNIAWNSPNCGNCYEVSSGSSSIYVTAIDACGAGPSGEMHFDLHPTAFNQLLGSAGVAAGSGYASFREVESWRCTGNLG